MPWIKKIKPPKPKARPTKKKRFRRVRTAIAATAMAT